MTFNEWRKQNRPRLRRTHPVAITHSGSRRRVYACLCGASDTECSLWPMTKHAERFVDSHNVSCLPPGVTLTD